MELVSANDGLLSNAEVMLLLEQRAASRKNASHHSGALKQTENSEFVEKQALMYIKENQNKDWTDIKDLQKYLKEVQNICSETDLDKGTTSNHASLTEAELIQLANHTPAHPVEVHLIVEECPERLTEDQIEKIAGMVGNTDDDAIMEIQS